MRFIIFAAGFLAMVTTAQAGCDVKDAKIEEAIAAKKELRVSENEQLVRDLRTLRDAAIVLDTYRHPADCEKLLAIVKALTADPKATIEQSGDTDEDKAEEIQQARKPKSPAGEAEPAKR